MKLYILIVIFVHFSLTSHAKKLTPVQRYIMKFNPQTISHGEHIIRKYPKYTMEVVLTFGMTDETIKFIESVIEENYSGSLFNTDDMNVISELVMGYLGGLWGIQIHEDPYLFYSTSVKRSTSFVVLDVSGAGIAVFKEA